MFRRVGIPILALCGLFLSGYMVFVGMRKPPVPPIASPPPVPPYAYSVAGSGIIEASSLNISIGTAIDGLIEEVYVTAGQCVKKGDPLLRVDTRDLRAQEKEALATKKVAMARLDRLLSLPRAEEVHRLKP